MTIKLITSIDDLEKLLLGEEPDAHTAPEGHICLCGSKQDAFDTALKTMSQMIDNDCPLWAIQIAQAMHFLSIVMSTQMAGDHGLTRLIGEKMAELLADEGNVEKIGALLKKLDGTSA